MGFQMAGSLYPQKRRTNNTSSTPKAPVVAQVPPMYAETHKWLMAYNGTFVFLLDLRSKLLKYGKLTDKQWGAIYKCMESEIQLNKPANLAQILVDQCYIPIQISANAARKIAKDNKWPINPCTLAITQIKNQTKKGITVRAVVNWTGNVGVCRCCGKTLTDWRSQATGVGPYCVKGTGFPYVRNQADVTRFQKDMEQLCKNLGEVEFFVTNWQITHGRSIVDATIKSSSPVAVKTEDAPVFSLGRFDWNADLRELSTNARFLTGHDFNTSIPEVIGVHNPKTDTTVKFVVNGKMQHTLPSNKTKVLYYSIGLDKPIVILVEIDGNLTRL